MPTRAYVRLAKTLGSLVLSVHMTAGCRAKPIIEPVATVTVDLASFGLATDFFVPPKFDCETHIIGYRSVVWLSRDRVAVVFNTSPRCRLSSGKSFPGNARLLVFARSGELVAKRDVSYVADGGDEVIAQGDALPGPDGTLLFRVEKAAGNSSAVRLFDSKLEEVSSIMRFMETFVPVGDHAVSFQQGIVTSGARSYDLLFGQPPSIRKTLTADWPAGTMDRKVLSTGLISVQCLQQDGAGIWAAIKVIYSGATRRCALNADLLGGERSSLPLEQGEVAEILGRTPSGHVAVILRSPSHPDQVALWDLKTALIRMPWFDQQSESKFVNASDEFEAYAGFATEVSGLSCRWLNKGCEPTEGRLRVYRASMQTAIVDRAFPVYGRASVSPDGSHYATFEAGQLRIYDMPAAR